MYLSLVIYLSAKTQTKQTIEANKYWLHTYLPLLSSPQRSKAIKANKYPLHMYRPRRKANKQAKQSKQLKEANKYLLPYCSLHYTTLHCTTLPPKSCPALWLFALPTYVKVPYAWWCVHVPYYLHIRSFLRFRFPCHSEKVACRYIAYIPEKGRSNVYVLYVL